MAAVVAQPHPAVRVSGFQYAADEQLLPEHTAAALKLQTQRSLLSELLCCAAGEAAREDDDEGDEASSSAGDTDAEDGGVEDRDDDDDDDDPCCHALKRSRTLPMAIPCSS